MIKTSNNGLKQNILDLLNFSIQGVSLTTQIMINKELTCKNINANTNETKEILSHFLIFTSTFLKIPIDSNFRQSVKKIFHLCQEQNEYLEPFMKTVV